MAAVSLACAAGGAAAPTDTMAAETARTASFRLSGRPMRTSRRDSPRSVTRTVLYRQYAAVPGPTMPELEHAYGTGVVVPVADVTPPSTTRPARS
ncbi:hypothetical protein Srubr_41890 [Streptomyces rubradiris]|uniref:Uncharacterized protein n=1 Tax=Streptomyces rubradiris TaxID=285531 RepID=A0ABQ3REQ6_STRRR|nr:hypothetical protein GCM10018792_10390 [Streptomyces rubradiris]GHI54343.1 hypothetical protein Srubr_41890 [Streptomyces rubradiris]